MSFKAKLIYIVLSLCFSFASGEDVSHHHHHHHLRKHVDEVVNRTKDVKTTYSRTRKVDFFGPAHNHEPRETDSPTTTTLPPPTASPTTASPTTVSPTTTSAPRYYASCTEYLLDGFTADGVYNITANLTSPLETTHEAYCDMSEDGGGWLLLYSYNHTAGQNLPSNDTVLPLSPTEGYSHTHLVNLNGYSDSQIPDEVRFYCQKSNHPRVIHFKTGNPHVRSVAFSGQHNWSNRPQHWNQTWMALTGHTGFLPDAATSAYSNPLGTHVEEGNFDAAGFVDHPFFTWGARHWIIGGRFNRFECDDYDPNGLGDSLHQVWVRFGFPPSSLTSAPTAPQPTASPTLYNPTFAVAAGACELSPGGNCFMSPNYPGQYGNRENCQISLLQSTVLEVREFQTEAGWDFLTVNGQRFDGTQGPQGHFVGAGDSITFTSDGSVVRLGFHICGAPRTDAPTTVLPPVCHAGASCGVCLTEIDPSECPANSDLLNCIVAAPGELCEGDLECGTNGGLDNCGGHDVYRKTEWRETSAPTHAPTTPGQTLAPTTPAPTASPTTPAPTASPTTGAPTTSAPTAPTASPTTSSPTTPATQTPTTVLPPVCHAGFGCGFCLTELDPSECPTHEVVWSLPGCRSAAFGGLCEADGECGASEINNCHGGEIYRKTEWRDTFSPTTRTPTSPGQTWSPTTSPTTASPTTRAPTTSAPTAPTSAPTTLAPTTSAPTASPTVTSSPTITCPTPFWTGGPQGCYRLVSEYKTWTDAQAHCENIGGNLASVHSAEENSFIASMMTTDEFWLGGTDALVEGNWVWSDGTTWSYTAWAPATEHPPQPDNNGGQHCLQTNWRFSTLGHGAWDDLGCSDLLRFVCKL